MAGHDDVEVTKEIIDCSPPLAEACAIQRIVIVQAHRQEFGLLRNRPDASLLLRARWIARRGGCLMAPQMTGEITMTYETKRQLQQRIIADFLRRLREAPPGQRVYMRVGDLFMDATVHNLDERRAA